MITIEIDDREIQQALTDLAGQVKNLRPVLREIGECLVKSPKQRFAESRAPLRRRMTREFQSTPGG